MRKWNIDIYVYLISDRGIHLYRKQSVYERTRKGINLQYFVGMNLKCNTKYGRSEFNI